MRRRNDGRADGSTSELGERGSGALLGLVTDAGEGRDPLEVDGGGYSIEGDLDSSVSHRSRELSVPGVQSHEEPELRVREEELRDAVDRSSLREDEGSVGLAERVDSIEDRRIAEVGVFDDEPVSGGDGLNELSVDPLKATRRRSYRGEVSEGGLNPSQLCLIELSEDGDEVADDNGSGSNEALNVVRVRERRELGEARRDGRPARLVEDGGRETLSGEGGESDGDPSHSTTRVGLLEASEELHRIDSRVHRELSQPATRELSKQSKHARLSARRGSGDDDQPSEADALGDGLEGGEVRVED